MSAAQSEGRSTAPSFEQIAEVARISKGKKVEIRVTIQALNGRRALDVRQWYLSKADGDWRPTGKGLFIDGPVAVALVDALQQAQQHLQQP